MLRRFGKRFVYVLIAALLLAQQGAALHALSHGIDALKVAKQLPTEPRTALGERHCDLCLTYAQMTSGAPATTPQFAAPARDQDVARSVPHPAGHALFHPYRSRAPPRAA